MRRPSGFTLIEAVVVLAILAILGAVAGASLANARKNASAPNTAYEVMLRFQGLKTRALQEQRDYALVFIDAANGDASTCGNGSLGTCLRLVVLSAPPAGWTLSGFDTRAPGLVIDDLVRMEHDMVLDTPSAGTAAAAPFATIAQFPASMQATCAAPIPSNAGATAKCYGIRFGADGTVGPIYPGAPPASPPTGAAFGFTSDPQRKLLRSWRMAALITFPTGISRSYGYP